MNPFLVITTSAILVGFLLNLIAEILNLKCLKSKPPSALKDFYDEDRYRKSQEYISINARFAIVTDTFELILIFGFWFSGGFNSLDLLIRSWGFGSIVSGLFFIGLLVLGRNFLMLGFRIYSTFVIEEWFSFNKTDGKTFILDLIKGLVLSLFMGGPILALAIWFFESASSWAPLYCWISFAFYLLIVHYIAPRWIMPLFYQFTPIEEGPLKEAILNLAQSVNFPLTQIYIIDGSKRSTKANAFFTGFGENKRVALFDTLINQHSIPELEAILAHEIGHYKKKHIFKNLLYSVFHIGFLLYCLSFFLTNQQLFDAFFMEHVSVYAGLVFFSLLFSPIETILSILIQYISRRYEREADRFATETIKNPEHLVSALKKLSINNLSNLSPHPFYVFLNHSHPPILDRIDTIRTTAQNLAIAE